MLSKCPECGGSYPSHHGEICKRCASKKNKPSVNKSLNISEKKPISGLSKKTVGVSPSVSKEAKKAEPEKVQKGTCPHCGHLNEEDDAFCFLCKKMIIASTKSTRNDDYLISDIKNIQDLFVTKLKKIGITKTKQLIEKAGNSTRIKTLSVKTGIPESLINRMVNQAHFLSIESVEPEIAFLLETIGINSLSSLKRKKPIDLLNLIKRSKSLLNTKKIFLKIDQKDVNKWYEDLKSI